MTDSKKPILLIEDDEDIRETIKDFLASEGYHVVTATNGKEGIEVLFQIEHPCLILLDMFMPVMDGSQFLEEVAKTSKDIVASIPVVIVSAAPPQSDLLAKAKAKAVGFVRKPIDLDVFLKVIESYCQKCC